MKPRTLQLVERSASVAALLTAVAAIGIGVYQARIMREQQKASVWPYIRQFNMHAGRNAPYKRLIANVGLGPAMIRSVEVSVNGKVVRNWGAVIGKLLPNRPHTESISSSVGDGSVILPGDTVTFLLIPRGLMADSFSVALQRNKLSTQICYCSIYQDCWIEDSEKSRPAPVTACGLDAARQFAQ